MTNYFPQIASVTGGLYTLPGGIKYFHINVQSGVATINGTPIPAPNTFSWTASDTKQVLTTASGIQVLCSGAGCRTNIAYF